METASANLLLHVAELHEVLRSVAVTVTEDPPDGPVPRIVEGLCERVGDAVGAAGEAVAEAASLVDLAEDDPMPTGRIRKALAACHAKHLEVGRVVRDELLDPSYQFELGRVAKSRVAEWSTWVQVVRAGLSGCRAIVATIDDDLLACWTGLAGGTGQINVSVHAVGQRFAGAVSAPPWTGSADLKGQ
jgi:hypothetical protein